MAKELIFSSAKKTIYRDGDTVIKEFCEGFPKAEVLNEALCNARVETIEALNVSQDPGLHLRGWPLGPHQGVCAGPYPGGAYGGESG